MELTSLNRRASLLPLGWRSLVEGSHKVGELYPGGLAPLSKLNQVHPPFASLEFAYFRLDYGKSFGELKLRESVLLSEFAQQATDHFIFAREGGLFHVGSLLFATADIRVR